LGVGVDRPLGDAARGGPVDGDRAGGAAQAGQVQVGRRGAGRLLGDVGGALARVQRAAAVHQQRDQEENGEGEHGGEDGDRSLITSVAVVTAGAGADVAAQHAVPRHMSGSRGATATPVIWVRVPRLKIPKGLVSMEHVTVTVTLSPVWAGWPRPGKPLTVTPKLVPVHQLDRSLAAACSASDVAPSCPRPG